MNRREYRDILFNSALTPLEKLTYAYLRSCMDWASCIVGDADKKLISYQSIREHLEYISPPRSNNKGVDVSRDQIKRILAGLVGRGFTARLSGQRYGKELRFFLPLASTGKVYPLEARHMRATHARHSSGHLQQGFEEEARHTKNTQARHTSSLLLSLNKYTYYSPDSADWSWLNYVAGRELAEQEKERQLETEKFNLRNRKNPDYDMAYQCEDWRTWLIYWVEYTERKR